MYIYELFENDNYSCIEIFKNLHLNLLKNIDKH